jgi:hypothetical protein
MPIHGSIWRRAAVIHRAVGRDLERKRKLTARVRRPYDCRRPGGSEGEISVAIPLSWAEISTPLRRIAVLFAIAGTIAGSTASAADAPPPSDIRVIPIPPASAAAPAITVDTGPVDFGPPAAVAPWRPIRHHRHWARRRWHEYGDPHDGCWPLTATHWGMGRAYMC